MFKIHQFGYFSKKLKKNCYDVYFGFDFRNGTFFVHCASNDLRVETLCCVNFARSQKVINSKTICLFSKQVANKRQIVLLGNF